MSKPKRGLGRGLGALIPTEASPQAPSGPRPSDVFFGESAKDPAQQQAPDTSASDTPPPATASEPMSSDAGESESTLVPVPGATFAHIDPYAVVPNPRQPRTVFDEEALAELVGSIREIGVLQPIVVRTNPTGEGFELIMGERRLRASKEAGLTEIPAIVRETEDVDLLRDALVENLHRSQLNPLEEAAAYRQLLDDFGITHEQLAERISRSRPQISNTLRLLKLPPPVQRRVAAGVLSAGHARALLGLDNPDAMDQLATRIVAEGLSVRATEEAVTLGVEVKPEKKGSVRSGGHTAALDDLSARLGDHLDTRVKVQLGRARGKITIDFATVEDLNRLVALIDPTDPGVFK
ncbi:ParB/RepB/Spo0J family partition protein [Demequina aurantiaca]|uniref:ParB/RepB/Spo0J family partition protein n=1 Tax=Demequina aurantiaca TaxID=676200 RepID=UPI000783B6B1|nr:ParB/RepB/Spo0J family partition protein [Demequina aurantiaca]